MDTAEKTYSRKRLEDPLNIYVLLSEPLEFGVAEVLQAVAEDYPTVPRPTGTLMGKSSMSSLGVDIAFVSADKTEPLVLFMACPHPKVGDIVWDTILSKSRFVFPQAAEAVGRHESLLCISVRSVGTSLAERFEAARLLTCIGAVFAKLPVCLGVYFPSADMIVPAGSWVRAADEAAAGKLPVEHWINLQANLVPDGKLPIPVTASSIGLAAFLGCEVAVYTARIEPAEAVHMVYAACKMLGEYGHRFRDSDTFGPEDDSRLYRIRFQGEGVHGAQTDLWALLHPTFPFDDVEMFGPRLLRPAPPGMRRMFRNDEGWLARLVGKARA